MKAVIIFCLIAICLANNSTHQSLLEKAKAKLAHINATAILENAKEKIAHVNATAILESAKEKLSHVNTTAIKEKITHVNATAIIEGAKNKLKKVNATEIIAKAKKHASNLKHKIQHNENVEQILHKVKVGAHKAAQATKHAVNHTASVAKAALNKTATWIKSQVANTQLNTEEHKTLAQKIAEKSKELLNKAKTHAANLKHKVQHNENVENVLHKTKVGAHKAVEATKGALHKAGSWIKSHLPNHQLNVDIIAKSKELLNKAKTHAANLKHKVQHNENVENVLHKAKVGAHKAAEATKHAANVTATAAKNALHKASSWIKSHIANHQLNTEEKHTLLQKIAEKSKALLNKAHTGAHNLKHKIQHNENVENVLHKAKHGAHKAGAAAKKAAEAAKATLSNVWHKLAGF